MYNNISWDIAVKIYRELFEKPAEANAKICII